jgi:hypothetical protein
MGLTIYYKLSVEKNLTIAVVRELMERMAGLPPPDSAESRLH